MDKNNKKLEAETEEAPASSERKNEVLPTSSEQRIMIFPRGRFWIAHMRKWMTFNDKFFDKVIKNFDGKVFPQAFIDKNHELGESFGDIVQFEKHEKGLYAILALNELGVTAVKDRQYRYISPFFGTIVDNQKQTHNDILVAITLTNIPALLVSMPQIQDQLTLTQKIDLHRQGGGNMNKLSYKLNELQKKIGMETMVMLQEDADPEAMAEVIAAIAEKITEIMELLATVTEEKEAAEEGQEEAEEMTAKIKTELAAKIKEDGEKEKTAYFDQAVKEGRVDMKNLESWQAQWDKDKDFVIKMLDQVEKNIEGQLTAGSNGNINLSKEDIAIMKATGWEITPENIAKYKRDVLDPEKEEV